MPPARPKRRGRRTALQRLNDRGILAWQLDGVLARLTARQTRDEQLRVDVPPLVSLGAIVAGHIRARVEQRGDLGDGAVFPGYGGRERFAVSAKYAALVGLRQQWYDSSAAFHEAARVKPGSYHVTGGMWQGVQARGSGRDATILDFQGSSQGAYATRTDKRQAKGDRLVVIESGNVRNQAKAGMIEHWHDVHVLRPSRAEDDAMAGAVAQGQLEDALRYLEAEVSGQANGDPALFRKLTLFWL